MPGKYELSMVVLAGGASSRMGRDKADLPFLGKTFLEIQIEKGRNLGISDIIVSGYRGKQCSARVVMDRIPGRGPLGGLETCFREARFAKALVLGIDIPLAPREELEKLIQTGLASEAPAVILRHGTKEEPLLGVYRTDLCEAMERALQCGKGSVFRFLNEVGYEVYASNAPDRLFDNINAPENYQNLNSGR